MYKDSILKESINNILSVKMDELLKDEMYIEVRNTVILKFKEFIASENTKALLTKLAEEKMLQFEKEDKALKDILPLGFENSLKVLVYNKGPEITGVLKGFITGDKFKHTIRVEINKFVSGMGPMASKFVNVENIYNRIMTSILSYAQSPETMMSVITEINKRIDEGRFKSISDFSNSIPYEGKISFIKALVNSGIDALIGDAFINSMQLKLEEELLKFATLRELLSDIGITEDRLVDKLVPNPNLTT